MKIAPIPSLAPVSEAPAPSVRSLRMTTNATPGLIRGAELAADDDPGTISDTNTEVVEEATQPLSPQLAALAKQRRALQVKERELADREKALEGRSPVQGDMIDRALLKSKPLSVLLDAGVTYDQLTEAILNDQSSNGPELQALKDQIAALEKGFDEKLSTRDQQAEEQVLAEMQREATRLASEGETFELVRETGSVPQVMELIKRTYKETGEVLDVSEAMQLVEDELIGESLKLAALKKVQGRLQPEPAPVVPQQRPAMRTLTNRDTAAAPMSRKERALLAFAGQLPKK